MERNLRNSKKQRPKLHGRLKGTCNILYRTLL